MTKSESNHFHQSRGANFVNLEVICWSQTEYLENEQSKDYFNLNKNTIFYKLMYCKMKLCR